MTTLSCRHCNAHQGTQKSMLAYRRGMLTAQLITRLAGLQEWRSMVIERSTCLLITILLHSCRPASLAHCRNRAVMADKWEQVNWLAYLWHSSILTSHVQVWGWWLGLVVGAAGGTTSKASMLFCVPWCALQCLQDNVVITFTI